MAEGNNAIFCLHILDLTHLVLVDCKTQTAKDLDVESTSAESLGDLKIASSKAWKLATTYRTILDSPNCPPDSDSTTTLKCLIAAAIDRAKAIEAREKASADRAEVEARLAKKRNVTSELLSTEEAYHRRLQRMCAGYLKPLEAELRCLRPLLSREQLAGVFGNIDAVLDHSAALLQDLRRALAPDSPQDVVAAADDSGRPRFGSFMGLPSSPSKLCALALPLLTGCSASAPTPPAPAGVVVFSGTGSADDDGTAAKGR
jgi:hypothetical protein